MAMKLNTGKVAFAIEFDNGDKQNIYFNPRSKTFRDKLFTFKESLDKRVKEINIDKYKDVFEGSEEINVDITDIDAIMSLPPEQLETMTNRVKAIKEIENEYQKAIKDALDDVFESPVSDIVFKYCEPMDMVTFINDKSEEESEMFIMQFIRAPYAEISKYAGDQNSAVEKHLAKYRK